MLRNGEEGPHVKSWDSDGSACPWSHSTRTVPFGELGDKHLHMFVCKAEKKQSNKKNRS